MQTAAAVAEPQTLVTWPGDLAQVQPKFDSEPFVFSHQLAAHPLFRVEELLELVKSVSKRPGDLYYDAGDVRVDQKWGTIPVTSMTHEEVLSRIETAGAWLIMKHVEEDPRYGKILKDYTDAILEVAPPEKRKLLRNPEMLIIVSSPNRITPFHIDGECNFLLQVQGHKTVRVFDRSNRSVLTEEEIERFYTVDGFAANFKPGIDEHAHQFELTPGKAIHIPVLCPHWVRNGSEVSVSISVNYEFPDWYRADLYRANWHIRRAGFKPTPPGSKLRDAVKRLSYKSIRYIRNGRQSG